MVTRNNSQRNNLGELSNQRKHQSWAHGIIVKRKKVYHPYTEIGFRERRNKEIAQELGKNIIL